jgi:hypothetical protein
VVRRLLRLCGLLAGALLGLTACSSPHHDTRPQELSPGASRLLVSEEELGPQAHKLLFSLKSDPFVYFRFINRPWSRAVCEALAEWKDEEPHVHLHGDAHVGQYAYTRSEHGLDDLDDSISGPAALDVVRFLGSVDLAARARGWLDRRERLLDEFFRAYRLALADPDYEPPVPSYVVRMRAALPEDPGRAEFLRWAESLMRPLEEVDERQIEAGYRRLVELIRRQRPDLPSFYLEPREAGWLKMGVGSALTPKLLFRCEGPTRAPEDDVLLEARELSDLSAVSCIDPSQSEEAARIIEGYGRMGRISHDIVVVMPEPPEPGPDDREWWARSWEPSYRELQLDELASFDELAEVIHDAAAQLGRGHAWAPEDARGKPLRLRQARWLDRWERPLRALTRDMAEDLLEAWTAFRTREGARGPSRQPASTGMPMRGQISHTKTPRTSMSSRLAGIPALKNSPEVN